MPEYEIDQPLIHQYIVDVPFPVVVFDAGIETRSQQTDILLLGDTREVASGDMQLVMAELVSLGHRVVAADILSVTKEGKSAREIFTTTTDDSPIFPRPVALVAFGQDCKALADLLSWQLENVVAAAFCGPVEDRGHKTERRNLPGETRAGNPSESDVVDASLRQDLFGFSGPILLCVTESDQGGPAQTATVYRRAHLAHVESGIVLGFPSTSQDLLKWFGQIAFGPGEVREGSQCRHR